MSVLPIPPRRFDASRPELIDLPDADPDLLRGEMTNLRKINRRFGGISSVWKPIGSLIELVDPAKPLEILDMATGSADVPVAIVGELRRMGRKVTVTAVDRNELVLAQAREFASGIHEIEFVRGDILSLAYPAGSFDIVLCSLALHHFPRSDILKILREMTRLCRIGFVLGELRRSYLHLAAAWIYTRLTTTNIMTRTDGIASILAAFTREELKDLISVAGAESVDVHRAPLFRLVATYRRDGHLPQVAVPANPG